MKYRIYAGAAKKLNQEVEFDSDEDAIGETMEWRRVTGIDVSVITRVESEKEEKIIWPIK